MFESILLKNMASVILIIKHQQLVNRRYKNYNTQYFPFNNGLKNTKS